MTEINSNQMFVDRYANSTVDREVKKELGKDDFLRILIMQLQYQDPMQPMEDKEFIAQMAQFSALEQMTNLVELQQKNNSYQQFQAFNLVGKQIEGFVDNNVVEGIVSEVRIKGGLAYLTVAGKEISMENITRVINTEDKKDVVGEDPNKNETVDGSDVVEVPGVGLEEKEVEDIEDSEEADESIEEENPQE